MFSTWPVSAIRLGIRDDTFKGSLVARERLNHIVFLDLLEKRHDVYVAKFCWSSFRSALPRQGPADSPLLGE